MFYVPGFQNGSANFYQNYYKQVHNKASPGSKFERKISYIVVDIACRVFKR